MDDRDYVIKEFGLFKMKYKSYNTTKCIFSSFKLRRPRSVSHWLATKKFSSKVQEFIEDNPIGKAKFLQ